MTVGDTPATSPIKTTVKVGTDSNSSNNNRSAEIPIPTHEAIIRRNQDAKAQQQAQHTAVISLTVKNTQKILKEIGFRRARLRVSSINVVYVYM